MQSSGIIQARKMLLFAALFLAILVPLFFALVIRAQLPLAESDRRRHLLQSCTPCKGLASRGAAVFPEHRLRRGRARSTLADAVLQTNLSRAVYGRLRAFIRAHFLSHHGRLRHQLAGAGILCSDALGLLSAGRARPRLGARLPGRHGMLFCQHCTQPQGEMIQVAE